MGKLKKKEPPNEDRVTTFLQIKKSIQERPALAGDYPQSGVKLGTDTLDMIFREGTVTESDEEKPGIILDYDSEGNVISIEVLEASKKLSLPIGVSFEVAPVHSTA